LIYFFFFVDFFDFFAAFFFVAITVTSLPTADWQPQGEVLILPPPWRGVSPSVCRCRTI